MTGSESVVREYPSARIDIDISYGSLQIVEVSASLERKWRSVLTNKSCNNTVYPCPRGIVLVDWNVDVKHAALGDVVVKGGILDWIERGEDVFECVHVCDVLTDTNRLGGCEGLVLEGAGAM